MSITLEEYSALLSRVANAERKHEFLEKALLQAANDLDDAADDIDSWAAYASEYFQEKHNLKRDIEETKIKAFKIRALITHLGR